MYEVISPIIFIIFNRPDVTQRVFSEIAKVKPSRLLVIADGSREAKPNEMELCRQTRDILTQVNWPCEVSTNFSDINLGCKNRIASGLNWAFALVPEAIILEDDCLPSEDFFRFCDQMLDRYRNEERVGMISGDNFQAGLWRGDGDYYFSRYCHIWGWATWARAWSYYDVSISRWPELRGGGWLNSLGLSRGAQQYWDKIFTKIHSGAIDTWDYQWTMACWLKNLIAIMPNKNLISNIGFGPEATHTLHEGIYSNMPVQKIDLPIRHPSKIEVDADADIYTEKKMFTASLMRKAFNKLAFKLGLSK